MMELFVAWIPLLALVGLALTIWCLYQRFRRAALGWAAATVCILLCAVWWYAPFHIRLAAEESIYCNVISASTQKLSREVYGSMLLGIPSAHFDRAVDFIKAYPNIQVEEVEHHVQ